MKELKNPLIIVANGEFPNHSIPLTKLKEAKTIIACDGASDSLLNRVYSFDLIIGDLDSISKKTLNLFKNRIIHIKDQSNNDLRKAIDYAKSKGIKSISIIGATGKREDHTIGNIFSLLKYDNLDLKIYTDTGIFSVVNNDEKIESFKGQQVSIFADDKTIKISSTNLKYNFNKDSLSSLFSGTLNESTGESFILKLSHGKILLFQKFK
ncbi:thiamine diphosphokinase [Candidatus Marinimicrobia bacterium]|nr:thiamine diphosphokinase [Candidatus Neomarinimicrobiota bacterium]